MQFTLPGLPRIAAGLALGFGLSLASSSFAGPSLERLADTVAQIEDRLDGRVGIALVDSGSSFSWTHRADERFLMNSTIKASVCGAVLARQEAGTLSLSETLVIQESDMLDYAPVTKEQIGQSMSIADLCEAAIDKSDNTATNLLINRLGGPQAVTEFFRSIGDQVSRLDRLEPALNTFAVDDPRDTTTPAAMTETLGALLLGEALTAGSRAQLSDWMSHGGVTGKLLRAAAPEGWKIYDKSGAGSHTRNILGVVVPDGQAPWIVTIFISDVDADFATRDAALQELSAAVVAVIRD